MSNFSISVPSAVLSVSPQKWLTKGDPVTLICEVNGSSTGWTFSWYTVTVSSEHANLYELLSDSSRGAGGNYTVSSAALKHTGVYVCEAEREKPAYYTTSSNKQPLWVTDYSSPVSDLIISPSRTQHFTSSFLSLSCEDHSHSERWRVKRYRDRWGLEDCSSQTGSTCTINSTDTSDTGVYWCQSESGENSHPVNITVHFGVILESPVHPVAEGDTLTLRCLYKNSTLPNLRADFYKDGSLIQSQTTELIISNVSKSHEGFYYCKHPEKGESSKSWISVTGETRPVLSVSPQKWLTEGDSVTLICEVSGSSTGWTFSWYTETVSSGSRHRYKLLSDSSRGAGGNYTVSSAALNHTGVYMCEAERGKPAYYTLCSNREFIWVTDYSFPVSNLVISPNRTQHFTSASLSLSCEDQSNSDRWTVRRYSDRWWWLRDCSSSVWGSQTGSTYTISSTSTSDTGVYWCQSKSGEYSHPVNITVHSDVILESPVHPLTEGDTLTLRCLYKNSTLPNLRADFYKDGSLIQSQTTEMIISTVSKSHEGFYYCKHPLKGKSPKSWISVRGLTAPFLTVKPQSLLFTGDSVTLRCEVNQSWDGWEFVWRKDSNPESTEAANKTINSVKVSDGGEYRCRARKEDHYTYYSEPVTVTVYERPNAKVTIKPDQHVFRGETVTLRCDIDGEGVTSWHYSWYKDGSVHVFSELQEHTFWFVRTSDAGQYSCYGRETEGLRTSNISDAVTLTVSDGARPVLSVSPQKWLTEGDSVTLICEVSGSSTGWTFSWYTETVSKGSRYHHKLLSDSSRGAGGNYTVSSAALNHTGVYVCEAERGKPAYYTRCSNREFIWVTDYSFPVSNLIISPNRTQHFTSASLSLSCEDQSNSGRWTVRRYSDRWWWLRDCSSSDWGSQTGSTYTISSTSTSDTGVYWCQSESGENSHSVNITVHSDVILESPVHPLTEGDTLTLRCLYQHSTLPNLRADFYKDGSLIQNQTTEKIISTVSKSHEGFYYCKHPVKGKSPKSWISVRVEITTGFEENCEGENGDFIVINTASDVDLQDFASTSHHSVCGD
ncbi:Fc receptor-like protein 5 [Garra rufa]|uniref:Fc receptor-like protein 5 n=1 Tax=Garra rufa TaxID=137080 RepID=UPI003CCED871